MTISSQQGRQAYTGDDVSTVFAVPFKFFDDSDLRVVRQSAGGVDTTLTLNVDYTLTGAGSDAGGSLTLASALRTGEKLTIILDPARLQLTDWVSNDAFPAEVNETALDRLTQMAIRARDLVDRGLHVPDGDVSPVTVLPGAAARAGKFLAFDNLGNPEPASVLDQAVPLTRSLIGEHLHPQTQAEATAGITPTNYAAEPGQPERYGAGQGPDDAQALADAITANAAGNPPVHLDGGVTYAVDTWTPLEPQSPVHIVGYGATVEQTGSAAVFLRPESEARIEGGRFKGFSSLVVKTLPDDSGDIEHLLIRSVKTEGLSANGVWVSVPISKYRIEGNDFEGHTVGYPVVIGRNEYPEQDTWEKGWVIFNSFTDISSSVDLNGVLLYGREKLILGNYLDGLTTSQAGTELAGIYTKARYNSIAFNVVRNLTSATATCQGINVKGSAKAHTDTPQGFATRVIGNHVEGVLGTGGTTGGLHLRLQCDESLAIGNTVFDVNGNGSALVIDYDFGGSSNVIMSENIARAGASATDGVGVRVTAGTDRIAVRGNILDGFHIGVRLASESSAVNTWSVTDNIIQPGATASNQGITVRRDDDIENIEIRGNHVHGGSIGIRFESGTGTVSNVRILDNDLEGCTTHISGTIPAKCQIRHAWHDQTTDGSAKNSLILALPDVAAFMVDFKALGCETGGGDRAMYHKRALVYRNGGGATLSSNGVQDIGVDDATDGDWNATIAVSGNLLLLRVQGDTGATVNWHCHVEILGTGA